MALCKYRLLYHLLGHACVMVMQMPYYIHIYTDYIIYTILSTDYRYTVIKLRQFLSLRFLGITKTLVFRLLA